MQMPLVLTNRRRRGGSASAPAFSPSSLYSSGSQGIWLDPSDLSTMFSDRAGTTPVTTPGTVVGLRLDKSKGGVGMNGASRRNLLTWSEDFGNAAWSKVGSTVPGTQYLAPDGTTTADKLVPSAVSETHRVGRITGFGASYINTFYVKAAEYYKVAIVEYVSSANCSAIVDLRDGSTINATAQTGTTVVSSVGDGWYRISWVPTNLTAPNASYGLALYVVPNSATAGYYPWSTAWTADGTSGVLVWGAQSELGSTASAYQKITADWASTMVGNHAVAPTDAARPTYGIEPKGGRRNLLLATDTLATQSLTVTAVAHTLAFTGTGTVTLSGASIAGPLIGTGASNRVSLTFTPTAASLTLTVVGSVTLGQLELGSSATAYQKVVTAYNVTESGVPSCHYVQYDGSDDSMSTAAIDFTATDKMSVFAGVRKLSDASGAVVELSADASLNNGSLLISVGTQVGAGPSYFVLSRGTFSAFTATPSSYAAPISNVLALLGNISGDRATARVNGTQVAQSTTDQGTGNYGNYAMFFGRRNNATLPFNGRDYGLIVVGKAASAGEITDTETWLAAKTAQVTL